MTVSEQLTANAPTPDTSRILTFEFTGKGREFFKIWIVNILLTILTLGIYSAWAKVRTQQYFYGNTVLDGASFRYTAKPLTILKGRIIAVAAFILFTVAQEFMPMVALAMAALFIVLMPAIIVRGMAFKLANSMHRNVRFGFKRNYREAYAIFLAPILALVALFVVFGFAVPLLGDGDKGVAAAGIGFALLAYLLGLPFLNYLASKFYVNNSRYGDSSFTLASGAVGFYRVYALTVLLAIGIAMLFTALVGAVGGETLAAMNMARASGGEIEPGQMLMVLMSQGLLLIAIVPAYLLIYAFFKAQQFNLVYGNSVLADHYGFDADLRTRGLTWLYLSNTLIIVFTLGLGTAWAKVRAARYHLANVKFVAGDDLNRFAATQQEQVNALGDEMGEVLDLEMGI